MAERGRLSGADRHADRRRLDPRQPGPGPARWTRMVDPAEQLRACAEECEAKAETALDPEVRLLYRDMAAQWRQMARQFEEFDSLRLRLIGGSSATGGG